MNLTVNCKETDIIDLAQLSLRYHVFDNNMVMGLNRTLILAQLNSTLFMSLVRIQKFQNFLASIFLLLEHKISVPVNLYKNLKKKMEKDLPACWGLCCLGEFMSGGSSLNDTDFSKDTDLSKKSYTTNR